MKPRRRRRIAIIAGLLVAVWLIAWWIRDSRVPKITVEPYGPGLLNNDDNRALRVRIHNDTGHMFRYEAEAEIGEGVRLEFRFQESAGWSEPYVIFDVGSVRFKITLEPRRYFSSRMVNFAPRRTVEVVVRPEWLFGPDRAPTPYQVGVRLRREPTALIRFIDEWFGQWLPKSFGGSPEVLIWSETITP